MMNKNLWKSCGFKYFICSSYKDHGIDVVNGIMPTVNHFEEQGRNFANRMQRNVAPCVSDLE